MKSIKQKIRKRWSAGWLNLVILLLTCTAPPWQAAAQELVEHAVSNGATAVSGGTYTGYVSAGQLATYLYSNGTQIATQGIILNQISSQVEFTFELNGTLTETQTLKSGSIRLTTNNAVGSGPPLSSASVNLVDAETQTIFATTQSDSNGFFSFPNIPYRVFFFLVNTVDIPENPVVLDFKSNIFIDEVQVNAEVGTDGKLETKVEITPAATCSPDNPDYKIWYLDYDNDGYGNPDYSVGQCTQPLGYVLNGDDCDDLDSFISPVAEEMVATGLDANCDGMYLWYEDADGDGFGSSVVVESGNSTPGAGESDNNLDCDDLDPAKTTDCNEVPTCNPIVNVYIDAPADPAIVSSSVSVSATFSGDQPAEVIWNWGDSTSSSGTISAEGVSGEHYYSQPGVYTLELSLTDSCGTVSTSYYKYVVIYDPNGDFVTGSGTIYSPPGASTEFPLASGTAGFGFVSKYDKNKSVPKGTTEFEFYAGNFYFLSTSYDWLVVAGAKAKFKGRGNVNGVSGFQFMLSAIDGDINSKGNPDLFRIKIWVESTGEVVYDNEMNTEIDADPATIISSGSIVVHSSKGNAKSSTTEDLSGPVNIRVYPNPTSGPVKMFVQTDNEEEMTVSIFNAVGQKIAERNYSSNREIEFDLTGNSSGIYLINTQIKNESFVERIILKDR